MAKVSRDSREVLLAFPDELSEAESAQRRQLVERLEEDLRSEQRWQEYLANEKQLLDDRKLGPQSLAPKLTLAKAHVHSDWVEVAEVELAETAADKRFGYEFLMGSGTQCSALFLSWAQLEATEGGIARAIQLLETGLKTASPASPNFPKLAVRLKEMRSAMEQQSPVPKKAAPHKKLPRLGLLGKAARIKPGEQKPAEEPEVVMQNQAEPPPTPLVASRVSTGTDEAQHPPPPVIAVKPVSPPPAPAGPGAHGSKLAAGNGRPGSLSPFAAPVRTSAAFSEFSPRRLSDKTGTSAGTTTTARRDELKTPFDVLMRDHRDAPSETPMHKRRSPKHLQPPVQQQAVALATPVAPRIEHVVANVPVVQFAVPLPAAGVDEKKAPMVPKSQQGPGERRPSAAASTAAAAAAAGATSAAAPPKSGSRTNGKSDSEKRVGEKVVVATKRLKIIGVLGSGGYSNVYKVLDRDSYNIFAMKDLEKEGDADSTFASEVRILSRLARLSETDAAVRHRFIQMYGFEKAALRNTMLLELGEVDLFYLLLKARNTRKGKLPVMEMTELRFYWRQILLCVAKLHELGIVHCDLKPANFVLFRGRLKLIDFGIAVDEAAGEPQTKGTLNYLSPEVCAGIREKRVVPAHSGRDVWALGCILYELAFERPPFKEDKAGRDEREVQDSMLARIADPKHEVRFPKCGYPMIEECVRWCLRYTVETRATADKLLKHSLAEEPKETE